MPAAGREIDWRFAGRSADGDFRITARVVDWQGSVDMAGLTVREPGTNKPRALAATLGEVGDRLARFRTRIDGKTTVQRGCHFTWLPAWFRIPRVGHEFTACQSSDGIEGFEFGKNTVALSRTALVGLLAGTALLSSQGGVRIEASLEGSPFCEIAVSPPTPPVSKKPAPSAQPPSVTVSAFATPEAARPART